LTPTRTDTLFAKYRFELNADVSGETVLDYSLQAVDPASRYVNIYTKATNTHVVSACRRSKT
jgi:hypothetical protein